MLKDERQHVKLVVSGTGDHMYVDCIPENGGKLPALVHVRSKYRIPLHRTIACGDSGSKPARGADTVHITVVGSRTNSTATLVR
eukprot:scaffold87_cov388-Prasinococcus_capsulatus_cf.AAC.5